MTNAPDAPDAADATDSTNSAGSGFLPWSTAMERALYGPRGFYRARGGPAAHFRTSVHASPLFATAIVRLLKETDEALGRPSEIALIDVGAGQGELLEAVRTQLVAEHFTTNPLDTNQPTVEHTITNPAGTERFTAEQADMERFTAEQADANQLHARSSNTPLLQRLRLIAVELAYRPDNLTSDIEWRSDLPGASSVTGLLVANEWLDNVPCDVVQATPDGWRVVEVSTDDTERLDTEHSGEEYVDAERLGTERPAAERLGAPPDAAQQAWLSTWWPPDASSDPSGPPERAEIGLSRDAAWRQAVAVLARGVAVAIDYAHVRTSRPLFGTLTGYARGRQVVPVPDGCCDITAHVALDSCAAAAAAAHAEWTVHSDQRTVLHSLGITGARPDIALASSDPRGYLRALSQASAAAELTDAAGLGGFGWLVQGVSVPVPPSLAQLRQPTQTPP